MGDEGRELYRARAKGGNAGGRKNTCEKRTTQGIAFSVVDRVQKARADEEKQMMDRINELLNQFTVPVGMYRDWEEDQFKLAAFHIFTSLWLVSTGICSYPFFLMSGNYFYRKQDKFVPAELALVKFSFRSGIQDRYHAYLNPGALPQDMYWICSWSHRSYHYIFHCNRFRGIGLCSRCQKPLGRNT